MAQLLLDNISKTYRPRGKEPVQAVSRVSLEVKDGEIVALLGSSGCGKTSMLRMIAGFEDVTEGAIRIGGKEIHKLPPAQRDVAMAFEGYSLYPPLKVRENIGFALLRERGASADIEKRVRQIAELLEMTDILDRYPTVISAGQQQRTSLARALIRRAPVSLLDEPMSQLEPQLRAILRARLKDYLIEHKMTTVFVTHDQTEAIALADRIAVMEKGELQQFGTPAEIKQSPSNLFVASFIGEPPMNIFDAAIAAMGDSTAISGLGPNGQPAFHLKAPVATNNGKRVRLGIRPHLIEIGTNGSADATGRVITNHWLGDQSHICFEIGGCSVVGVTDRPIEARPGDALPVRFPLGAVHLFDAESGRALAHGLGQRGH
ncbi:MAG TPA: ABC transporter ATP-binding protein [Dongiaceae bacterium]|jgi:multiple sugar transport system ATP-binding protein|nr:ABC transporter ATP-binding protein [Dongiaceae bacterium]